MFRVRHRRRHHLYNPVHLHVHADPAWLGQDAAGDLHRRQSLSLFQRGFQHGGRCLGFPIADPDAVEFAV